MVVVSVLYPAKAGAKFDQAYYEATHIPMVKEAFASTGLKDVQVLKGLPGADGGPPAFVVIVNLTFESPEALAASLGGSRGGEVQADVVNFTDITPVFQVSAPV